MRLTILKLYKYADQSQKIEHMRNRNMPNTRAILKISPCQR